MIRDRLVWAAFAAALVTAAPRAARGEPQAGAPQAKDGPLPAGAFARLPASLCPALFSPDGKHFLAGSATEHHVYCLWDVGTKKVVRTFRGPKKPGTLHLTFVSFTAAALSADGKALATASDEMRLWDVATGKLIRAWPAPDGVRAVELSADGQTLLSTPGGGRDEAVRLWDTATGKLRHELPGGRWAKAVCLSPSGKQVAVLRGDAHEVTVYDVASGVPAHRFAIPRYGNPFRVTFHPDGKSLYVANMADRGGVWRYEVATGKDLGAVVEQADVRGVAFPKDFAAVATMSYADRVVRFWGPSTGKERRTVTADNTLWAIALSPDGKVLATQAQGPKAPFLLWKVPD
jgi:WD40 repeat protein